MVISTDILPNRVYLDDFNGDSAAFIAYLYDIFKTDFIDHKSFFGTHKIALKHYPLENGYSHAFYHFTHTGKNEEDRVLDLRRSERLPWARPAIEKTAEYNLSFWKQPNDKANRVCIWIEAQEDAGDIDNYYVILDVRETYVLLWTTFYGDYRNAIEKKRNEYQKWKSENPDITTPDMLINKIQDEIKARAAKQT